MFLNDYTVETNNAIINLLEGSIIWKAGMFNPKAQNCYNVQIAIFQDTKKAIRVSDFNF